MMKKVIVVFTRGDSRKLSTWSNVPYFLTKTLKQQGFEVIHIDVSYKRLSRLFRYVNIFNKIFINRRTVYEFNRTGINAALVDWKMRRVVRKYKSSILFISLGFSFCPYKYTDKTMMLGDWSIDYMLEKFLQRKPDKLELKAIERERKFIDNVQFMVSLFPDMAKWMENKYGRDVHYCGNVVNSVFEPNADSAIAQKIDSSSILFIGKPKYREGAKILIETVEKVKIKYPEVKLNIIGMSDGDFENLPDNVICYGYLDKSDTTDCVHYYKLLNEAKIVVNTTAGWGAFSSLVEAMYWYTPIITTPYSSFVSTFGKSIDFGLYAKELELKSLYDCIQAIFEMDYNHYMKLCTNARESVQHFTWDEYIKKILQLSL